MLLRKLARGDPVGQRESRTYRGNDRRFTCQAGAAAQAIHGFDASAMRSEQICDVEFFHLVAGPVELLVRRRIEMQAADDSIDRTIVKFPVCIGQDVDDAGVAAARYYDQALGRIQHYGAVFWHVTL